MKEMTPKERETALLEREKPDRVPIWQINGIVASHHFGHMWKDVRGDAKLSVDIMRKFSRLSGTDIMAHGLIEPNAIVMDLPGVQVKFQDNNYSNVMSYYYNEPEDIDNKELYDPSNPKEAVNLWKYLLNKVALMAEVEKDYFACNTSWSVFTTAGFLRNVESLMMDIILEPDIAHKIMDKAAVLVDGSMRAGMDKGCNRVYLADPSGSGSLVSGETFEEFASPHLKRMIAGYKKDYGAPTYFHVCGETLPVAKQLSELGAAVFSFDYMNKVTDLRDIFEDKAVLAGNLDPMNVVWMGTPESVINASKKCIEDMDGSRFILATGCETPRDAPLENLQAMLTATKKYSKF